MNMCMVAYQQESFPLKQCLKETVIQKPVGCLSDTSLMLRVSRLTRSLWKISPTRPALDSKTVLRVPL